MREAVPAVLTRAIAKRGSTIRDYVGGSGLGGGFQHEFCVYGRTGDPCVRCGSRVQLMRLAGRANWWAPPPLRRLHDRFGIREGEAPTVVPLAAAEPVRVGEFEA